MRTRLLLIASTVFPIWVGAQQPTATAEKQTENSVAQTFRSFGRPYGAWLIAAFDSIPASKYAYKPTEVQQSIGYIAQHLENANYQLCALFGKTKYVMTARDSLADTVKAKWPKDTLVARVKASLTFCGNEIAKLTDKDLADEMKAGSPGAQVTVTRARYLILLVTDLAEHYSQLAGYMRLIGMVPPSALPLSALPAPKR